MTHCCGAQCTSNRRKGLSAAEQIGSVDDLMSGLAEALILRSGSGIDHHDARALLSRILAVTN